MALQKKSKYLTVFLFGAKEGIKTVISIFPTLIALFLAINALQSSGILGFFQKLLNPVLNLFAIPR